MSDDLVNSAVVLVTQHLQNYEKDHITGALLGELIRRHCPTLNLRETMNIPAGPGALRKFVAAHLQSVLKQDGPQGSDTRYFIIRNANPLQEELVNPAFWQSFVRFNKSKRLLLREGKLALGDSNDSSSFDGEKLIASATKEELEKIRQDFVDSLGTLSSQLPALSEPYYQWDSALKKLGGSHFKDWKKYRPEQIETLFDKRLQAMNIDSDLRARLCEQMRRSHSATKRMNNEIKATAKSATEIPTTTDAEFDFRTVVQETIKNLPLADLRELKLPAGAMYDALLSQLKK